MLPSFATAALTWSGVMSWFTIETWTVPAAALALAAPVLGAWLAGGAVAGVPVLHAAASRTAENPRVRYSVEASLAPVIIMAPTTVIAEIALVSDISGV